MSKKSASGLDYHAVSNNFKMIAVIPKNDEQKEMLKVIARNKITFVKGAPGSGKTFIAVSYALQQLLKGKCEKIIFSRPTIEAAGEKMGFLPGDMYEKINPYMIPIFESLLDMIPADVLNKLMSKNGRESVIRVLPLAFMRGVTFKRSIVIADECQNTTPEQMRMLLTRLGEDTKMIICGDIKQSDIYVKSGLEDAFTILRDLEDVGFVTLSANAIVRDPLVREIDKRYSEAQPNTV